MSDDDRVNRPQEQQQPRRQDEASTKMMRRIRPLALGVFLSRALAE